MGPELQKALHVLQKGGVVAFPTDTVWGLLADPENPVAIERIYAMKKRPRSQPLQLLVADLETARTLLPNDYKDPRFEALAERFWPGPLTLIVPAGRPFSLIGAHQRLGLRVPAHEALRKLLQAFGGYLAATSLNLSGKPPIKRAEEAQSFPVDYVVPGEPGTAAASSVVDLVEGRIVRSGAVPADELTLYLKP